jgi:hypothetical protein
MVTQKQPFQQAVSQEAEQAFARLIQREIEFSRDLNRHRMDLKVLPDFTPLTAFKTIDTHNAGLLSHADLKRFLKANGHLATSRDLINIVRRIDLDNDAQLNLEEWGEALRVTEPGVAFYSRSDITSSSRGLASPYRHS